MHKFKVGETRLHKGIRVKIVRLSSEYTKAWDKEVPMYIVRVYYGDYLDTQEVPVYEMDMG